jgi:hypothetical protein
MTADRSDAPQRFQLALKLAVLALMVAAAELPINHLFIYALLALAVTVLAIGRVTSQRMRWATAVLVLAAALTGKLTIDVPKIEEGHNVFMPGGEKDVLAKGLPPDVYRAMAGEFDRAYPEAGRCDRTTPGCSWNDGHPARTYAFSFDKPTYSRRVTRIDFSDAEWQRLGFVNELAYNWSSKPGDVDRGHRRRGLQRLLHPWDITMPHFVMFTFPAAFAGSELCWRGTVMWEGSNENFTPLPQPDLACRTLTPGDIGKRIFGLAISPNSPLAMKLRPTPSIRLFQFVPPALALAAVTALLLLLVRWHPRHLLLPLTFVALSLVVIVASDSSLLGGVRPFDSGDDGLVFDGWSRTMTQQLLAGDIEGALKGIEPVFYFTPGSRYLRMVEHLIFGETYLGYVSLLLLLPFLVFCFFRRYFTARVTLAMALIFIAIPVGALFGSTLYNYVKHAAHGYGDPAAAILFLAGTVALLRRSHQSPRERFAPAFGAGLLLALALFVRPNLAVGAAVLLGGAGLAALWQRQMWRLAGMCLGFLPVFSAALHNWYFGGVFVLFSSHTGMAQSIPMPPYDYLTALWELLHLNFGGDNVRRGELQIYRMLTGPSESFALVPVHAAALVIVARVMLSPRYDGWLRLTAATTLGLISPALFFIHSDRYHLMAWLFMLLVCCAWIKNEGLPWLERRFPGFAEGVTGQPAVAWVSRRLDGFARATGAVSAPSISAA